MVTSPSDAFKFAGPTSVYVPADWVPVVPAAGNLPRPFRALRANTAGTITVITPGSSPGTRVMNFAAGEQRLGIFLAVTAATSNGIEGAV